MDKSFTLLIIFGVAFILFCLKQWYFLNNRLELRSNVPNNNSSTKETEMPGGSKRNTKYKKSKRIKRRG